MNTTKMSWILNLDTVLLNVLFVCFLSGCLIAGGSMNHYTSGIVGSSLNADNFNEFMLLVKNNGKEKLDAVINVLQKQCPKEVKYTIPEGGFFMWMELPSYFNVQSLNEYCKKTHNISFQEGVKCSTAGNCQNCLRICFMYYTVEELIEAVSKLLTEIKSCLNHRGLSVSISG